LNAASDPEDPDALSALGRQFAERGDLAMAIALLRHALRRAPGHAQAAADLAAAYASIAAPGDAAAAYAEALRHEPDIAVHHRAVGSLQRFVGMERVAGLLMAAVRADPSFAPAHAALANLAARRGDRNAAMRGYALAVMLDWADADAHLALAQLYDTAGNARDAERHRREALARKTRYASQAPYAVRRVLLLKTPGSFLANALPEFCLDANRTNVDALYLTGDVAALPAPDSYDVLINAMSATEEHAATIERCRALIDAAGVPAINHPARLDGVRRAALPQTLRDVPGCVVPPVRRLTRAAVEDVAARGTFGAEFAFPILIRPVDTQRGDGLERIHDAHAIAAYLERFDAAAFTVTPFVDYRSPDGHYRKYRVIVVDGVPYPYHLAISDDWLVHYWRVSRAMRASATMRAEEERFLAEPAGVFPTWTATFGAMARAVGLDVFGVDCARDDAGRVLVFECDPSAFVHAQTDVDGPFDYKLRYVPRIFAAFDDLLAAHASAIR
jgi:tetratricopeptide (TPR) repeat protein